MNKLQISQLILPGMQMWRAFPSYFPRSLALRSNVHHILDEGYDSQWSICCWRPNANKQSKTMETSIFEQTPNSSTQCVRHANVKSVSFPRSLALRSNVHHNLDEVYDSQWAICCSRPHSAPIISQRKNKG